MTHPIGTYLGIVNLTDGRERAKQLPSVVAPDVTYLDAHAPNIVSGAGELEAFLAMFRERVPHVQFEATRAPDVFHHAFRQSWRLTDTVTGAVFSTGMFVGTTNAEGKLNLILGFIDQEPAATSTTAS
jgi:hypothetical protein